MSLSHVKSTAPRLGLGRMLWGGVPPLFTAGLLLAIVVGMAPLLMETAGPDQSCALAASGETAASIRQIRPSADGRQVHVVRHPTEWQLVDIDTGVVRQQQTLARQFCGSPQRIKALQETVIYRDHHGCHVQSLWNADAPRALAIPSGEEVEDIVASPESDLVALRSRNVLRLWSVTDGTIHATLKIDGGISAVEWAPDGRRLLVLLGDGRLQCRDGTTLELLQSQPTPLQGGGRLVWSASGRHVAAYSQSGCIATWDLAHDAVESFRIGFAVMTTIAFAPDGDYLVIPDTFRDVWVWPTTGDDRQRRYLGTAHGEVSALCFVDDGQALLVGTLDGRIEGWSTETGLPLWTQSEGIGGTSSASPSTAEAPSPPMAQRGASCASTRS